MLSVMNDVSDLPHRGAPRGRLDPLATDDLDRALAPLPHAWSMPAAFYTDRSLFDRERERIFLHHWLFLLREDDLSEPGDYRSLDTPGGPVLAIRGDDRRVRVFANVCRHRGSILLEGRGRCRRIVCPYHAWSYRPDGSLATAPDMEGATGFEPSEHGLVPVRHDSWAGFLFITFDTDAPALCEHLGDLPDRMASHRLDRMRCTWRIKLDCRCNWKLILENAMETYHTGTVHRATVGRQTSRSLGTRGQWRCIQVVSGRSIATLPGAPPPFPPIDGLDADARQGTYFTVLHPTCQFAVAQDSTWWLNLMPRAADRTDLEIGGCFPETTIRRPDFEEKAAAYYERWEAVGREDVGILEKQQVALASTAYRPGRLSARDDQVQALGRWVIAQLAT